MEEQLNRIEKKIDSLSNKEYNDEVSFYVVMNDSGNLFNRTLGYFNGSKECIFYSCYRFTFEEVKKITNLKTTEKIFKVTIPISFEEIS